MTTYQTRSQERRAVDEDRGCLLRLVLKLDAVASGALGTLSLAASPALERPAGNSARLAGSGRSVPGRLGSGAGGPRLPLDGVVLGVHRADRGFCRCESYRDERWLEKA
jgi:hypothetical protein